jgi:type VI secretion system protein ImpE
VTAEELLRAERLDEALSTLQDSVRKEPANPRLRRFLFQLQSVLGRWDKALNQINVLESMDSESLLLARIFGPVLQCEALRSEVFAGKRTPLIFGEPEGWIGELVEANSLLAQGKTDAANELRARAFDAAPAVPGKINDQPFEWIADADTRLGPMLEAMLDGKYYWVPFSRIRTIVIEPPSDLRDFVWIAAQFIWTNGGNAAGFIPTRYPGSEASSDAAIRLSRKTEWEQVGEDVALGRGQRLLATDQAEYPLLEVRKIELYEPVSAIS